MTTPSAPDPLSTPAFRADLEKFLELYFAQSDTPLITTGWVLLTASVDPTTAHQGTAMFGVYMPVHQPPHVTRGLMATSITRAEAAQQRELFAHWAHEDQQNGDDQ